MKLLDGKLYDPGTAVSKATTSLLALTAIDTTNLRLTVTVPKSGKILVRMGACVHGATTCPQIVLGVLEGSTVRGRRSPMMGGGNLAATTLFSVETEFLITGLTPGASFAADAAYGVETVVASTGLKYGGPNNTTGNDNFGGFQFELWDPDPYTVDASGNVQADVREVNGTAQTAGDICARLPAALVSGRMDSSVGAMAADVLTAAATAADFGTEVGSAVWASGTRLLTAGTNIALAKGTGVTGFNDLSAAQVNAECDTAIADAALATAANLSTVAGYLDTEIAAILADTNELQTDWANGGRLDLILDARASQASVDTIDGIVDSIVIDTAEIGAAGAGLTALASAADLATVDTVADAIQAKTDSRTFTLAGKLDVNVLVVNGATLQGAGTSGDKWRPA